MVSTNENRLPFAQPSNVQLGTLKVAIIFCSTVLSFQLVYSWYNRTGVYEIFSTFDMNAPWKKKLVCQPVLGYHQCVANDTLLPMEKIEAELSHEVRVFNGRWKPHNCIPNGKIAIIVPYRNRQKHLRIFLLAIHRQLQFQLNDYHVFIVEQVENQTFNRGKLMNVGYVEASKMTPQDLFTCFVFHDVDLIPMNGTVYNCRTDMPVHLSSAIDRFNFRLPYSSNFGGVSAFTPYQFRKINGFSNKYWGWGGEDDDSFRRVRFTDQKIFRFPKTKSCYHSLSHTRDKGNEKNPNRWNLLRRTAASWQNDGLSDIQYKVINIKHEVLYTKVYVNLLERRKAGSLIP